MHFEKIFQISAITLVAIKQNIFFIFRQQKDLYEILGVNRNATPEEIKKAYRRVIVHSHEDIYVSRVKLTNISQIPALFAICKCKFSF